MSSKSSWRLTAKLAKLPFMKRNLKNTSSCRFGIALCLILFSLRPEHVLAAHAAGYRVLTQSDSKAESSDSDSEDQKLEESEKKHIFDVRSIQPYGIRQDGSKGDGPLINHVTQRGIGNCWMMAAFGALAVSRPEAITKIIKLKETETITKEKLEDIVHEGMCLNVELGEDGETRCIYACEIKGMVYNDDSTSDDSKQQEAQAAEQDDEYYIEYIDVCGRLHKTQVKEDQFKKISKWEIKLYRDIGKPEIFEVDDSIRRKRWQKFEETEPGLEKPKLAEQPELPEDSVRRLRGTGAIWSLLLEKAYAKLHGCEPGNENFQTSLVEGRSPEAFMTLTNMPCKWFCPWDKNHDMVTVTPGSSYRGRSVYVKITEPGTETVHFVPCTITKILPPELVWNEEPDFLPTMFEVKYTHERVINKESRKKEISRPTVFEENELYTRKKNFDQVSFSKMNKYFHEDKYPMVGSYNCHAWTIYDIEGNEDDGFVVPEEKDLKLLSKLYAYSKDKNGEPQLYPCILRAVHKCKSSSEVTCDIEWIIIPPSVKPHKRKENEWICCSKNQERKNLRIAAQYVTVVDPNNSKGNRHWCPFADSYGSFTKKPGDDVKKSSDPPVGAFKMEFRKFMDNFRRLDVCLYKDNWVRKVEKMKLGDPRSLAIKSDTDTEIQIVAMQRNRRNEHLERKQCKLRNYDQKRTVLMSLSLVRPEDDQSYSPVSYTETGENSYSKAIGHFNCAGRYYLPCCDNTQITKDQDYKINARVWRPTKEPDRNLYQIGNPVEALVEGEWYPGIIKDRELIKGRLWDAQRYEVKWIGTDRIRRQEILKPEELKLSNENKFQKREKEEFRLVIFHEEGVKLTITQSEQLPIYPDSTKKAVIERTKRMNKDTIKHQRTVLREHVFQKEVHRIVEEAHSFTSEHCLPSGHDGWERASEHCPLSGHDGWERVNADLRKILEGIEISESEPEE